MDQLSDDDVDKLSTTSSSNDKLSYFAIGLAFIAILLALGVLALYIMSSNNKKAPTGSSGGSGPTGDKGAIGDQGPTGLEGPIGDQGPTGVEGPIGDQGPTGVEGPGGNQGPRGPTGATGRSEPETVLAYGSYVVFSSQGKYSTSKTYSLHPYMSYATIVSSGMTSGLPFPIQPSSTYATAFYISGDTIFKLGDRFSIIANVPFYILSPHNSVDPPTAQKIYLPKQILYNNNINFNNIPPDSNNITYTGCIYFPAGYLYNFTITDISTGPDPDGVIDPIPIVYYSYNRTNLAGTFTTIWNYNYRITTSPSTILSMGRDIPIDYQSIEYIQNPNPFETPIVAYNNYRFTIANTQNANLITPEIIISYQALSPGDYFFYEPYNHNNNPTGTYSSLTLSTEDPTITITIINSTVPNGTNTLFQQGTLGIGLDRYTINLDFNSSYKITLVSWINNFDHNQRPSGTYLISINKIPYSY
jgi:hypothetical protein